MTPPVSSPVLSISSAAPRRAVEGIAAADDDQLEAAAGRVDRLARTDPARDELPGIGDQDEVALDLDQVAVGHDPEP